MTYPFGAETPHRPTAKPFHLKSTPRQDGARLLGTVLQLRRFGARRIYRRALSLCRGKWTTQRIPLARTIGVAIVIDVPRQAEADRDYRLSAADIRRWEKRYGRVPTRAIVLMHSGWNRYWGDRKRYFGGAEAGDASNLHFPGFARMLPGFRQSSAGSRPSASTRRALTDGPAKDFIVHQVFGAANVPIFRKRRGPGSPACQRCDGLRHSDAESRRQRRAAEKFSPSRHDRIT